MIVTVNLYKIMEANFCSLVKFKSNDSKFPSVLNLFSIFLYDLFLFSQINQLLNY